jgi:hypothetical protein
LVLGAVLASDRSGRSIEAELYAEDLDLRRTILTDQAIRLCSLEIKLEGYRLNRTAWTMNIHAYRNWARIGFRTIKIAIPSPPT